MFHLSNVPKNRIWLWVMPGLLMLFLVGCSGSKTTEEKDGAQSQESTEVKPSADASKDKKGAGKEVAEAEKMRLEEARKAEKERKDEQQRLAREKRLAEERERREAEERRLAEERYRAAQVRETLGEVQPPPPSPPAGPPGPVVDQFGNPRIVVQADELKAAGPLDRSVSRVQRAPLAPSGRKGQSGAGKMSDSSLQRGEQAAVDAGRQDSMAPRGPIPADKMPAGKTTMARKQPAPGASANTMITLVPFESAVPPLPKEPVLRVAVLSDIEQPEKANQVALIIGNYTRETLENQLGMMVKIAYVAQIKRNITRQSVIRYRPEFFRAAVTIAKVLPLDQALSPMTASELSQKDVDLVVYLGRDYR